MPFSFIHFYIIIICAIMAYTAYNTSSRELITMVYYDNPLQLHNILPKFKHIYTEPKQIQKELYRHEYVHSIWVYSLNYKYAITRNNIHDIPIKMHVTFEEYMNNKQKYNNAQYSQPFIDNSITKKVFMPCVYVHESEYCIVAMLPLLS